MWDALGQMRHGAVGEPIMGGVRFIGGIHNVTCPICQVKFFSGPGHGKRPVGEARDGAARGGVRRAATVAPRRGSNRERVRMRSIGRLGLLVGSWAARRARLRLGLVRARQPVVIARRGRWRESAERACAR